MFRFIVFPIWQGFHVHLERRQMMHKVAAVFSLLRMEGCLTTPVPLLIITGLGAHLMLFTVAYGLIAVRKPDWKIPFLNENSKKVAVVIFLIRDSWKMLCRDKFAVAYLVNLAVLPN